MSPLRALVPAALLLVSCGRLEEVDVTRTATGTIPGGAGGRPLSGGALGGLGAMLDPSVLRQHGLGPGAVDSARLVALTLAVTRGTSFDAWLDAVSVYVEAAGLPRALVARRSGIRSLPAPETELALEAFGVDLKPYLLAPSPTVSVSVSGTQPAADTTIVATATLRVSIDVTALLR